MGSPKVSLPTLMTLTLVHALKYAFNKTLSYFWYLKHRILTRICSEAYKKSLKKLCSEIINFHSFQRQFLQLCFKYASEQILVKIQCLKYQKLFKILFKSIFQGMYYRADKTDTLTSIQHTVCVWGGGGQIMFAKFLGPSKIFRHPYGPASCSSVPLRSFRWAFIAKCSGGICLHWVSVWYWKENINMICRVLGHEL